jgi:hypothetical protein
MGGRYQVFEAVLVSTAKPGTRVMSVAIASERIAARANEPVRFTG